VKTEVAKVEGAHYISFWQSGGQHITLHNCQTIPLLSGKRPLMILPAVLKRFGVDINPDRAHIRA
jgi:uncharacterized protein YbcV (DUF1398 family)